MMHGKTIVHNLITLLVILTGVVSGRAMAEERPVVILLSDTEQAYVQPVDSFQKEIERPVAVFNLRGDIRNDLQLKAKILAVKPALIFALGAKAAYIAKLWTRDHLKVPVLFAMVINWSRYDLASQPNVAGISAETAPGTQFVNMAMFSPKVGKIGVIYSDHSSHFLEQARKAADILGLGLVSVPIQHPGEFRHTFKKIAGGIDAYWVLHDPVIYTLDNMDWLKDRCVKERLVCVGQSVNIARMGLVLAVNPDPVNIGSQIASMARNILQGRQTPEQIGVMDPLATNVYVNIKTADRIGLAISQAALGMATKVEE